ncbi:FtsX-like permease family protein [compost metagenome]
MFGLLGSVLGSVASYALVWVFNNFGPGLFYIPVSINLIMLALLLAILTGVLAAAIPARRAAALDPVEAIRHV